MFSRPIAPDAELCLMDLSCCDELFALVEANRQRLSRWFAWVDASRSADDTRAYVRSVLEGYARDEGFNTVIRFQGRIVGTAGFHEWKNLHRSTSIGYWLDAAAEGKGLMTAAVRALVDHALIERGLNRVEIRAATDNARSQAVARRLGFVAEGVARQAERIGDRYHYLAVFSMLARDWPANRPPLS
jgi:ribosomal-protein-serine acetyltransferase